MRFFQGNGWPGCGMWRVAFFFVAGERPSVIPARRSSLESKRFPLVWDELKTTLPTWRALRRKRAIRGQRTGARFRLALEAAFETTETK